MLSSRSFTRTNLVRFFAGTISGRSFPGAFSVHFFAGDFPSSFSPRFSPSAPPEGNFHAQLYRGFSRAFYRWDFFRALHCWSISCVLLRQGSLLALFCLGLSPCANSKGILCALLHKAFPYVFCCRVFYVRSSVGVNPVHPLQGALSVVFLARTCSVRSLATLFFPQGHIPFAPLQNLYPSTPWQGLFPCSVSPSFCHAFFRFGISLVFIHRDFPMCSFMGGGVSVFLFSLADSFLVLSFARLFPCFFPEAFSVRSLQKLLLCAFTQSCIHALFRIGFQP